MGREEEEEVSWKEMFRSVSLSKSKVPPLLESGNSTGKMTNNNGSSSTLGEQDNPIEKPATMDSNRLNSVNFQLAIYIAMAHAGLLLLILTLYGLGLLLRDFWKPIQWAVLCSITLREIQGTLVRFWETPLQQGFLQTFLAVPFAVCKGLVETLNDAHSSVLRIFGRSSGGPVRVGFLKLFQWLVTFAVLTIGYDTLGAHSMVIAVFTGLIAYAGLMSLGFFDDGDDQPPRKETLTGKYIGWAAWPVVRVFRAVNRRSTRFIAARLRTIIAVGLIVMMILVSVAGMVIFTYKAGLETKDAVVGLKNHVQQSNYSEVMGLKNWLENSNIEQHASTAYEMVAQQIDQFGVQYNLTEFTDAGKEYLMAFARGRGGTGPDQINSYSKGTSGAVISHPVMVRLQNAKQMMKEYEFGGIYTELEAAFRLLLDHFQLKPEDVKDKVKQMSETGADIGKRVLSGSTLLLSGGTSVILAVGSSIASGAAGLFNFLTQAAVFFSLLYYLITSESGGVVEQVLSMVPLSAATRYRSATVLNHAVSSVLLATVKSAFFQGSFTWLLFSFFRIHFLYVSTLVAISTAVFPVLPHWLATLPAAAQLVFQGDYVFALVLSVFHFLVLDFGNGAVQDEIPGHNAYLAPLSIAGGMALFSPALEGAILGPLLMTLLIALKNLYSEFILHVEDV